MGEHRTVSVKRVLGAHTEPSGGANIVLRDDEGDLTLEIDSENLARLLGLAAGCSDAILQHDGMRISSLEGQPVLSLKIAGGWLSILLGQADFDLLRTVQMPRPPSGGGGSGRAH